MTDETKLFWAQLDVLNDKNIDVFLQEFGDLETAREKISINTIQHLDLTAKKKQSILKKISELDIQKIKKIQQKYDVKILYREDKNFPKELLQIPDAPIFLFYRGNLDIIKEKCLAVVGSRKPTQEGKWALEYLLPDVIQSDITIVSGMAQGIDSIAHNLALEYNGSTVAFCGTGLDMVYPSNNTKLYQNIAEKGVLFSEFPFQTIPMPYNFPRRNRLVSGISDGIFVVEGKQKSGSLITADFALEQGKDVLALPGNIKSPLSKGPNHLIQQGAQLVQSSEDILEVLGVNAHVPQNSQSQKQSSYIPNNPDEKKIHDVLSFSPVAFDSIIEKTGFSSAHLSSTLMMMSLQNAVGEVGNGFWVRK